MAAPESPVPLSAVALRLTDEVGHAVLDWVAAGDLAASAALDQHVAAVRAELAVCQPHAAEPARLAGQAAGQAARSAEPRPHHARRSAPRRSAGGRRARSAAACPDVPFADGAWHADAPPALRLLLHYACGFVEAAVKADWWPGESEAASGAADFEAVRLAAVCRLIRQAEATAAVPPELG